MISERMGRETWCRAPPVGGFHLVGRAWSFSPIYGWRASGLPYRGAPSDEKIVRDAAVGGGLEAPIFAPGLENFLFVPPYAGAQAGQEGGAERRGLDDGRARDGHAQDVRLQLHEEIVGGRAAVDLEHGELAPAVLLHRRQDVVVL